MGKRSELAADAVTPALTAAPRWRRPPRVVVAWPPWTATVVPSSFSPRIDWLKAELVSYLEGAVGRRGPAGPGGTVEQRQLTGRGDLQARAPGVGVDGAVQGVARPGRRRPRSDQAAAELGAGHGAAQVRRLC